MNWEHNGGAHGKAGIHPLSLHLSQRLTLPLLLLLSLSGAHLCLCASAHMLSFLLPCLAHPELPSPKSRFHSRFFLEAFFRTDVSPLN